MIDAGKGLAREMPREGVYDPRFINITPQPNELAAHARGRARACRGVSGRSEVEQKRSACRAPRFSIFHLNWPTLTLSSSEKSVGWQLVFCFKFLF